MSWNGCYFTSVDVWLLQLEMSVIDRVHYIVAEVYQSAQGTTEDGYWWSWDAHCEFSGLPSCFSPIIESPLFCSSFQPSLNHPNFVEILMQDAVCHPLNDASFVFGATFLLWRSLQWYPLYVFFRYGHLSSTFGYHLSYGYKFILRLLNMSESTFFSYPVYIIPC